MTPTWLVTVVGAWRVSSSHFGGPKNQLEVGAHNSTSEGLRKPNYIYPWYVYIYIRLLFIRTMHGYNHIFIARRGPTLHLWALPLDNTVYMDYGEQADCLFFSRKCRDSTDTHSTTDPEKGKLGRKSFECWRVSFSQFVWFMALYVIHPIELKQKNLEWTVETSNHCKVGPLPVRSRGP